MNLLRNILLAVRGEFSTSQLSARLFMAHDELTTPENYLIWFHERFHYLQSIFTPYGHLKWASYRTVTADMVQAWIDLPDKFAYERKIPIYEYLNDGTIEGLKIASTIWMNDTLYQIYSIAERGVGSDIFTSLFPMFDTELSCPKVKILGQPYSLRGLDIFESFAKFEEAMLNELITGKNLDETINPDFLNKEYYYALYYFIEELGPERLVEFPIVCELALACSHIPSPTVIDNFCDNAPNWRFVKIIEVLKHSHNLPKIDVFDDKSFFEYSNFIFSLCGYESWEEIWNVAEEYAKSAELTMAREMMDAINYKKENPWMLSYPMRDIDSFTSEEFNRFFPYFTITDDGVMYNIDKISSSELIFENHLQALALQICGHISKYCIDTRKLMCGYTYMGLRNCPHYVSGECDGYIDCDSELPDIVLDANENVKSGCTFEMILNINGTSIRNITIGRIQPLSYNDISKAAKIHFESDI